MEISFVFVAGGIFVLAIMVYVLFMIFLPEWVGITGKKALEAERSHVGDVSSHAGDGPASEALARMENIKKNGNSNS